MTTTTALAELEDLQRVLSDAGYRCKINSLGRFSRVLLAENPYAVIAGVETEDWGKLVELVSDIQAELTRLALGSEQSSIRWDLYVLVHVRNSTLQQIESDVLDRVESDTKYARKFVRVNLTRDKAVLDRALRPFLPLRPAAKLDMVDPMNLVRAELIEQGIDIGLVEHVLSSFATSGKVSIP